MRQLMESKKCSQVASEENSRAEVSGDVRTITHHGVLCLTWGGGGVEVASL